MILDTELFISLKNDVEPAVALVKDLERRGLPTRIPTIVIQELYVSVGAGNEPSENARQYEALIANKPVVTIDENIARRAGALEGVHLSSDGKPTLGAADAIVAATGLTLNEAVVSNDEDFESVEGLNVELY